MSTFVDLLPRTLDDVCEPDTIEVNPRESGERGRATWDADSFAEEQIRGLVRQVFRPVGAKPAHQVVFSSVDPQTDIGMICLQIGLALSKQASGTTCLVEANPSSPGLEQILESNGLDLVPSQEASTLRDPSRRLSSQLWLIPRRAFLAEDENGWSSVWLRNRLADLRQTFDYTVLYGPPAATCSDAAPLASLCDGMVLVLQANLTRRVTAQRVKEKLHSANARLLGTVLSDRTFPIPETIYRKL